jgi:hypothetical protein
MKLAAANVLPGAKGRLLPPAIPFSFFAAAISFHVILWAVALLAADDIPTFRGGLGHPLGALHVLVLGVLASTAMGASFQLLPVATRQPLVALWPARAAFWLFVPGVVVLVHGMGEPNVAALIAGGMLATGGLLLFAGVIADNLRRATSLGAVATHGWVAIASLVALIAAALGLAFDFRFGLLADHHALAVAHAILGLYGFMGMLAVGFSYILVPMFALAEAVPAHLSGTALILGTTALIVGVAGALADRPLVSAGAAALGTAAALVHVGGLARVMRRRMRKRLGLSFILIRGAWAMLPTSLVLGGLAALDLLGPRGPALFGFVAALGWLLTFLIAILQRILPFLASMHTAQDGRPALVSELGNERATTMHAICHSVAVPAIAAGIALDLPNLVRAGAAIGLVGALAFAWFGGAIVLRIARQPLSRPAVSPS